MSDEFDSALEQLALGRVVAAATESFFGLLADIGNPRALAALLDLKPRGADKGIPVLLPERASWSALVDGEIPGLARAFADAFWPGALSIALRAPAAVPPGVALDGMLAVRLPGASPAAELTRLYGRSLSATSANLPGAPPALRSTEVEASFAAAIAQGALFVLRGESPGGAPSTVIRVSEGAYAVARVGRVQISALETIARSHARNP